jgi:Uma2 family endonuclease
MPAEHSYVPAMPALMTADELLQTHIPDKHVELVRGVLVVREPPGLLHGRIAVELARRLANHAETDRLGRVYVESGFKLASDPDTVRGPDVAFVSQSRLPDPMATGFGDLAPDLVAEILSPGDRPGEVLAKVGDWLSAGARLVWVLDPERRLARVYRGDGTEALLTADDTLDGEDVLPGFSCRLATVLA